MDKWKYKWKHFNLSGKVRVQEEKQEYKSKSVNTSVKVWVRVWEKEGDANVLGDGFLRGAEPALTRETTQLMPDLYTGCTARCITLDKLKTAHCASHYASLCIKLCITVYQTMRWTLHNSMHHTAYWITMHVLQPLPKSLYALVYSVHFSVGIVNFAKKRKSWVCTRRHLKVRSVMLGALCRPLIVTINTSTRSRMLCKTMQCTALDAVNNPQLHSFAAGGGRTNLTTIMLASLKWGLVGGGQFCESAVPYLMK